MNHHVTKTAIEVLWDFLTQIVPLSTESDSPISSTSPIHLTHGENQTRLLHDCSLAVKWAPIIWGLHMCTRLVSGNVITQRQTQPIIYL